MVHKWPSIKSESFFWDFLWLFVRRLEWYKMEVQNATWVPWFSRGNTKGDVTGIYMDLWSIAFCKGFKGLLVLDYCIFSHIGTHWKTSFQARETRKETWGCFPQHKLLNFHPFSRWQLWRRFLRKANGQMDSRKSYPRMHADYLEKAQQSDSTKCHTDWDFTDSNRRTYCKP